MKDVFSKKELVELEYFIKDMGIKIGYDSQNFAVTNGCATYLLYYLDGFEQRTCLFKPSYFGRNPKGNWIAVDFIIGKNGKCVLGSVRNIDPSVAKNSSNYRDFYKGYVGKYREFDVPHDFFDYMNESKKSARSSIKESKIIKCVDLGYDSHTGKDYYDIVLDLRNGNLYYIKNASCSATAISYCCEINGLDYDGVTMRYFKIIYWNECAKGVQHIVDTDKVNKKYKKYIKDVILEDKLTEKSLKEYFDYKGEISIEDLMSIMTDEWQFYYKNRLFNESSHYVEEARDEDRYLEISAVLDFDIPASTGYSFSNSRIEKEYNKGVNEVYDMTGGDDEEYYDVLSEYSPILLILTVDLKERIIYAKVDLGNGIGEVVARERLPDDENSFRKTIDKMIDSF